MTTWAAASEALGSVPGELTVRNVVRTTVGGSGLRLRLTNAFGRRAVTFGRVCVGVWRAGAALEPGTNRAVTFGGAGEVTLAPGATVLSDPVAMAVTAPGDPVARHVRAWQRLAVSIYLRGECDTLTGRNRATAPSLEAEPAVAPAFRSLPGDHAADEGGGAYTEEVAVWHWLDALTVVTSEPVPVVAVLGDSLTTGVGSETGHGWADLLAHRVSPRVSVVNEGVSGGKVLAAGTGRPAEERLAAEVLTKPGIDTVILAAGVNDLGAGARAEDLIAACRRIVATAHAAGVRVVGATITPFAGAEFHTSEGERARQAVNAFVREGGVFDGPADFDAALRDPADPGRLLPRHDCGDHLHPSAAGHHAMAAAIDLPSLTSQPGPTAQAG